MPGCCMPIGTELWGTAAPRGMFGGGSGGDSEAGGPIGPMEPKRDRPRDDGPICNAPSPSDAEGPTDGNPLVPGGGGGGPNGAGPGGGGGGPNGGDGPNFGGPMPGGPIGGGPCGGLGPSMTNCRQSGHATCAAPSDRSIWKSPRQ